MVEPDRESASAALSSPYPAFRVSSAWQPRRRTLVSCFFRSPGRVQVRTSTSTVRTVSRPLEVVGSICCLGCSVPSSVLRIIDGDLGEISPRTWTSAKWAHSRRDPPKQELGHACAGRNHAMERRTAAAATTTTAPMPPSWGDTYY